MTGKKLNNKQRLTYLESRIDDYISTQEPGAKIRVPPWVMPDVTVSEIRQLWHLYKDAGFSKVEYRDKALYLYTDMDSISKASITSILGEVSNSLHPEKGYDLEELPVHYKYWKPNYY